MRPAELEINQAAKALREGDMLQARRWAIRAALLAPALETPWLILASVVSPQLSLNYLVRALKINPQSQRARAGIHWAVKSLRSQSPRNSSEIGQSQKMLSAAPPQESFDQKSAFLLKLFKRILSSGFILICIAFITIFGLYSAQLSKQGLPLQIADGILYSARQLLDFIFHHPQTYLWHKETVPWLKLVSDMFFKSAGLMLISLAFALFVGGLLGIFASTRRRRNASSLMVFISMLGISLPSFLIAMLLWVANIGLYRIIGGPKAPFPPTGFGWDTHMVMPALVLAARPLAQIMQVTYVKMSDVMDQDYIRLAKSKGASNFRILTRHALRNITIPLLTTLGTSLRFSLASLPVVESFFMWPGIGWGVLQAFNLNMPILITDLIVALGLFFLIVNSALDFLYAWIDPRIRSTAQSEEDRELEDNGLQSLLENMGMWWADFRRWALSLGQWHKPQKKQAQTGLENWETWKQVQPVAQMDLPRNTDENSTSVPFNISGKQMLRSALTNAPFMLGLILILGLVFLSIFGEHLTAAKAVQTNGMMMIEGQIRTPPFSPSPVFPWGSDPIGRDIQALVLSGARQTLTLALIATIARVLLGTILGVIAGWWRDSWLDRLINSLVSVWSAFPDTVFAMVLILGLGIQRGRSVFIIALCLVGWGEITQFVRSQVIQQKPELYIEAARSEGARPGQILSNHILPALISSIIVLMVMEMSGVLMLLAELGFLNIFLGGGFKASIAETYNMSPIIYYFSDMPEWGALLANIRNWWRSYPWLAWYPGLFFFLAIFTFNLAGEGLRRFLNESKFNLNRLVNRYTIVLGLIVLFVSFRFIQTSTPVDIYKSQADDFNAQRAMQDIKELSASQYLGRGIGTSGNQAAADYIAEQMKEIGLNPIYSDNQFINTAIESNAHITGVPYLQMEGSEKQLIYRKDFREYVDQNPAFGDASGAVVGFVLGPDSTLPRTTRYELRSGAVADKVLIVRQQDMQYLQLQDIQTQGILVIDEDLDSFARGGVYPHGVSNAYYFAAEYPILQITPQLAEDLLASAGTSIQGLDQLSAALVPDEFAITSEGYRVQFSLHGYIADDPVLQIVGVIPGTGAQQQTAAGSMDSQVIMVSAYFDGLGTGPDGAIFPGANDNASGVAAMLELARVLKNGSFSPEKTILFVAWSGGEWGESLSITNILNEASGYNLLTVESVLELSGVGSGSGDAIFLGDGTSYRLMTLFEDAARKTNTRVTSRGRGPHFGTAVESGFGGRTALSAYISWDGSDQTAHSTEDTYENIDPVKLEKLGKTTTLVLTVLSREQDY